jgi:release factor glutamine methyltransferase
MTEQPWTVGRLRDWTTQHLKSKGFESARLETELLLAHALGCSKMDLYVRNAEEPTEAERARFRELLKKRLEGAPVAHLLGKKEFFSLEFEVGPDVLIPRPDTEWLVTEALALAKPIEAPEVLDIGTGSGCLAVAIARQHKGAKVTAIDISKPALVLARRNAEKHKVADRVQFEWGDVFSALVPDARFDLIVSNPPYIRSGDISGLDAGVRNFEPRSALDGGPDGFAVIARILREAPPYLKEGGHLLCEVGHDQAEEAQQRFKFAGWTVTKTTTDGGGHVRVVVARR